ncbi:hypothetical protein P152DRAFT_213741 [Eremomyces bilateralis CBS 781.70]|uniref:Uncharacterized protein n=1 Tax=Eremomyces bilateralis CBS 781.70 TaxID=1392243 RepID=A0A6G1FS97_9PEZI|nr:uncharacterized protein P152DRAFT_213741 [Eremomyces bilateralis CBS 781.70]KAF1808588.1 hypothetical protein P152DRAFT_213741 [Eremomyces bilateralis CBS 781.70]
MRLIFLSLPFRCVDARHHMRGHAYGFERRGVDRIFWGFLRKGTRQLDADRCHGNPLIHNPLIHNPLIHDPLIPLDSPIVDTWRRFPTPTEGFLAFEMYFRIHTHCYGVSVRWFLHRRGSLSLTLPHSSISPTTTEREPHRSQPTAPSESMFLPLLVPAERAV